MATLFRRAPRGVRQVSGPDPYRVRVADSRGSTEAPTWLDYRLDLVRGRSDAPRIPAHQVERLFPEGAPRSWELLIERPQQPVWVLRVAGALVSVVVGTVAVLSPAVAGVAATIGAGLAEMLSIAGHVLSLAGADGVFGAIGRLATVVALSVPLTRLLWRAARWGVAPIGDDQ